MAALSAASTTNLETLATCHIKLTRRLLTQQRLRLDSISPTLTGTVVDHQDPNYTPVRMARRLRMLLTIL